LVSPVLQSVRVHDDRLCLRIKFHEQSKGVIIIFEDSFSEGVI